MVNIRVVPILLHSPLNHVTVVAPLHEVAGGNLSPIQDCSIVLLPDNRITGESYEGSIPSDRRRSVLSALAG